jgi:citrate lyase subunit beta/citryl-CoA lyase
MRSLLFVPGDSERKLARGLASDADVVIFDLEDSVAGARKAEARRIVADMLRTGRGNKLFYVRINPLGGPHALADLAAVMPGRPDGIMLPKATPGTLSRLDHNLESLEAAHGIPVGATGVVAIATETAGAMFELGRFGGVAARLAGLTWGAEDLAADLGAGANRREDGVYDDTFRLARSLALLGAQAAGVAAIDTVYVDYRNTEGLEAECRAARRAGFVGKMAIHPDQVGMINAAFSPTEAQLAWARAVSEAFAANPDAGTIGLDGKMIDRPHLLIAERILRHRST